MANLMAGSGNGWDGNTLTITNEHTLSPLFGNVGASFTTGSSRTEGPFCATGCGCFTAQAGGGYYLGGVSWSLEIDGETFAAGEDGEEARFCAGLCSTSCGVGEQPNGNG